MLKFLKNTFSKSAINPYCCADNLIKIWSLLVATYAQVVLPLNHFHTLTHTILSSPMAHTVLIVLIICYYCNTHTRARVPQGTVNCGLDIRFFFVKCHTRPRINAYNRLYGDFFLIQTSL